MEKLKYIKSTVLSDARKNKKLSHDQLSDLSGVNKTTISALENQSRVWLGNRSIAKLVNVLNIDLSKVDIIIK